MQNKEIQEMELWGGDLHNQTGNSMDKLLHTTVHEIKNMEWQDFFFLWNCWKSFSEKLEWFGFFCDKKYEDQFAYRRLMR